MIYESKASHIASGLSMMDILAVLFANFTGPHQISNSNGNRLHVSKGHAAAAYYAMANTFGLLSDADLSTYCQNGSLLGGHLDRNYALGITLSTGSLGHALPFSAGRAYANKYVLNKKSFEFVILSDGELDEGSNWEAVLFSAHHELSHLVVIVDRNRIQSLASTETTLRLDPLDAKFLSFGFNCQVLDGHSHSQILSAIQNHMLSKATQPLVLICETTKGKGISFMENSVLWHYRAPSPEEFALAQEELGL